jgi:hypothetical protein
MVDEIKADQNDAGLMTKQTPQQTSFSIHITKHFTNSPPLYTIRHSETEKRKKRKR